MIVIELAELLSEWWFPLSTNPGRASIEGWVTLCGVVSRQGGQMKCSRTAGLGYTNKNSAVARVAPFFLIVNTLKNF